MGSGPSPPTYPLANSFKLEAVRAVLAGAKALADAKRADVIKRDFTMVGYEVTLEIGILQDCMLLQGLLLLISGYSRLANS